jgi:hypothetical protein
MNSVTEAGAPGVPAAPLRFRPLLATAVGTMNVGYPRGGARVLEWTASAAPGGEPAGARKTVRPELLRCWLEHLTVPNKLR